MVMSYVELPDIPQETYTNYNLVEVRPRGNIIYLTIQMGGDCNGIKEI